MHARNADAIVGDGASMLVPAPRCAGARTMIPKVARLRAGSCDQVRCGHEPEKSQDFSDGDGATASNAGGIVLRVLAPRARLIALALGSHPPMCGILASAMTFFHFATSVLM
jgi:hypothetical protein